MEFDVKIKIDLPEDVAETIGINEDSYLETYYEKGHLYIRSVPDEELDEMISDGRVYACEDCEFVCPHCKRCINEV